MLSVLKPRAEWCDRHHRPGSLKDCQQNCGDCIRFHTPTRWRSFEDGRDRLDLGGFHCLVKMHVGKNREQTAFAIAFSLEPGGLMRLKRSPDPFPTLIQKTFKHFPWSVPGMNVAQTSAREFNITSRAATGVFSGSQLALIDGRTIYHDDFGYLCWDGQAINLEQIKQVEVIRGPASAVWGANAMNGIVNIVTKLPREMLGTTMTLGMGTFDRSGGGADSDRGYLYYLNATHAQALNDRWAFKITAGAFTQDAFARPQCNIPNAYNTTYPPFTPACC